MRWRIRGLYAQSGEWKIAIVDAPGKPEAEAIGAAGGLTQITSRVELPKWAKAVMPLFVVAMFGLGLFKGYHGHQNSPREMGALVGSYVFGAVLLTALISPIVIYLRKLGYELGWILYIAALICIGQFTAQSGVEAGAWIGKLIYPLIIADALLVMLNWRRPHVGKLLAAVVVGMPVLVIGLSQVRWKTPAPAVANARDILNDLSDLKNKPTPKLPEVREGTKASGLAPFMNLAKQIMERTAVLTTSYQQKVAREHPERILRPANLIDAQQRALSRKTIEKIGQLGDEHEKAVLALMDDFHLETAALDMDPTTRANLMVGFRTSHENAAAFLKSQKALDWEAFQEMLNALDLMDRAKGVTLSTDGKILFVSQRDLEDYNRSISRLNRLIALHQQRQEEFARHLPQSRPDNQDRLGAALELKKLSSWDPVKQSGARVVLNGRTVAINGKSILLPIDKALLIAELGKPRETMGKDLVYLTWDELGVGATHNIGSTKVWSMMVALHPEKWSQWPKEVVQNRLTLLGVAVDENSTPWTLNRRLKDQKFSADDEAGKYWAMTLERYKLETTFQLDGSINHMTITAPSPKPAAAPKPPEEAPPARRPRPPVDSRL